MDLTIYKIRVLIANKFKIWATEKNIDKWEHSKNIKWLSRMLMDVRADIRWRAAVALYAIDWQPKNNKEKAAYLAANLEFEEIDQLGVPAIKSLMLVLHDKESSSSHASVIKALGKIGNKRAVPMLIYMLKNGENYFGVQMAAIEALEKIKDKRAILPLIDEFKYGASESRYQAVIKALSVFGTKAIVPLIDALRYKGIYTNINRCAALTLGEIGGTKVIAPIVQRLYDSIEDRLNDSNYSLIFVAPYYIEALKKVGEPAVETLLNILNDEKLQKTDIHQLIINALKEISFKVQDNKNLIDIIEKFESAPIFRD
ncbi:MAG: HEAT repeat domain-containing protein [Vicingaceae bacterium]|nr:HEAT repeat domain-containing protein [Vicingaceae bacterium]